MDRNDTSILSNEDIAREAISAVMNTVGVIASTPVEVKDFLRRLAVDIPLEGEENVFDAFKSNPNFENNLKAVKLYLEFFRLAEEALKKEQ